MQMIHPAGHGTIWQRTLQTLNGVCYEQIACIIEEYLSGNCVTLLGADLLYCTILNVENLYEALWESIVSLHSVLQCCCIIQHVIYRGRDGKCV